MATTLDRLRDWLNLQPAGEVKDAAKLTELLMDAWDEIGESSVQSTSATKLFGRIEKPVWSKPTLIFEIERHGGTVMGSSRAAIHQWEIDVQTGESRCNPDFSYRQISRRDTALKTEPLAKGVCQLIVAKKDSGELRWNSDKTEVTVKIGEIIEATNDQTTSSRRGRFRKQLEPLLAEAGWYPVSVKNNTYCRTAPN